MEESEICKTIIECVASDDSKFAVLSSFCEKRLISYEAFLNSAPFSLLTASQRNEKMHSHYEIATGNRGPK